MTLHQLILFPRKLHLSLILLPIVRLLKAFSLLVSPVGQVSGSTDKSHCELFHAMTQLPRVLGSKPQLASWQFLGLIEPIVVESRYS